MPNIILTSNARFSPFTFDEMLKLPMMNTQAHQAVEDAYADLNTKASVWENMADEQRDNKAYTMYKKYADDLRAQADNLAASGLNPTSRQAMLDLKGRYASEIVPIEQAFAARQEEAKNQYEGRARGIVYEGDASVTSLDRYLGNPSIRYGQANSQEGFKRVATAAAALAKGLRDYGNGKRLDSYTKTWLQEHGYRDTDVASAIADVQKIMMGDTNINTNGVLRDILSDEMNTSGVNNWKDINARMDYFNRVAPALYQAVGQTAIAPYEDFGARLAAEEASANRRAKAAAQNNPVTPQIPDFPVGTRDLPVGVATNREAEVSKLRGTYDKMLGIRDNKSTKIQVKYNMPGDYRATRSISTSLFIPSQNNRLKTRAEFMNAGKSNIERKVLGEYYDNQVTPILKEINNGSSKGINYFSLKGHRDTSIKQIDSQGTSTFITGINYPLGTTSEMYGSTTNINNNMLWELGPEKGNIWTRTKSVGTLNDYLQDKIKNNKQVNATIVTQNGNNGIVFSDDEKMNIMPLNLNDSQARELQSLMDRFNYSNEIYKQTGNSRAKDVAEGLGRLIIQTMNNYTGIRYKPSEYSTSDQLTLTQANK